MLLSPLKIKALLIGSGLLLVALLALGVYHKVIVATLESKVSSLTEENSQLSLEVHALRGANVSLAASVDKSNAKVRELVDASNARELKAATAIADAKREAQKYKTSAEYWRNYQPDTQEQCPALIETLQQYVEERNRADK